MCVLVLSIIMLSSISVVAEEKLRDRKEVKEKAEERQKKVIAPKPALIKAKEMDPEKKEELIKKRKEVRKKLTKDKKERVNTFKKKKTADKAKEIKELKAEGYREFQKDRLMVAVEKCQEKGSENCELKETKRLELVKKLKAKDVERMKKFEERRLEKEKKLEELEKDEKFKKFKKGKHKKARELKKEKLEKTKEKVKEVKKRYTKAKENFKEAKEKHKILLKEKEECTEDCEEKEKEVKNNAVEYLTHIADKIIFTIDKTIERANENEHLTEELADSMIAVLKERKKEIEEAKATLENLNEDSTEEEIDEAAATIKKYWKKAQPALKREAGKMKNAKVGAVIVQSKQLGIKLEKILERMVEKGYDTTVADSLVEEFNALIDEAKTNYESATEQYKEGGDPAKASEYFKAAYQNLKDARVKLKEIVDTIKAQKADDAITEVEYEEEEEEEEDTEGGEEE